MGYAGNAVLVQSIDGYNMLQLISIFVFIAWTYFAMERLYDTLLVRCAVVSNQQAAIGGLGHMLGLFRNTRPHHSDSVMQTRLRSKAKKISAVYCPVSLTALSIKTDTSAAHVSFDVWVAADCTLMVVTGLSREALGALKGRHDVPTYLAGLRGVAVVHQAAVAVGNNSVVANFDVRDAIRVEADGVAVLLCQFSRVAVRLEEDTSMSAAVVDGNGGGGGAGDPADLSTGGMRGMGVGGGSMNPAHWLASLLPSGGGGGGGGRQQTSSSSGHPRYDGVDSISIHGANGEDDDVEIGRVVDAVRTREGSFADLVSGGGGGRGSRHGSSRSGRGSGRGGGGNHGDRPLAEVESAVYMCRCNTAEPPKLLLHVDGRLYEPQEVFGMTDTPPLSDPAAAASSSAPPQPVYAAAPGLGLPGNAEDECVVCLANGKEVLLLPCRHLCVCRECFVMIDKCPVCRSTFEGTYQRR